MKDQDSLEAMVQLGYEHPEDVVYAGLEAYEPLKDWCSALEAELLRASKESDYSSLYFTGLLFGLVGTLVSDLEMMLDAHRPLEDDLRPEFAKMVETLRTGEVNGAAMDISTAGLLSRREWNKLAAAGVTVVLCSREGDDDGTAH